MKVQNISENGTHVIDNSGELEINVEQGLEVSIINKINSDSFIDLHVAKDAKVKWFDVVLSEEDIVSNFSSYLDGTGSECEIKSLFFGNGTQKLNLVTRCVHRNMHTKSDIVLRGVVDGESNANCKGLVRIEENAPQSEGYQQSDILIINSEAEANSLPELEIENNDVKCSHGSTVGKVNEESIFYLMARGLSREDAVKSIVEGFLFGLLDVIKLKDVKEEVLKLLERKYAKVKVEC
jgi:Fe-S cluster assembly protein SufD